LATFLIDVSPSDMQRRLGDALAVYVDAMRYPRGTEDQRASMWLEHTRRYGWKAVAAVEAPDRSRLGDSTDRSAEALAAALNSPVRTDMRADFAQFPPYRGRVTHYAMTTRVLG